QSSGTRMKKIKADLAIVTALYKEREAVEAIFGRGEVVRFPDDNHIYRVIRPTIAGVKRTIVVGTPSDMGNGNAATVATNLARSVDFERAAMVGIAGGMPRPFDAEKHVRLGDVVISDKVVEYDRVKQTIRGIEHRDSSQRVGFEWTQAAVSLRGGPTGFS